MLIDLWWWWCWCWRLCLCVCLIYCYGKLAELVVLVVVIGVICDRWPPILFALLRLGYGGVGCGVGGASLCFVVLAW